MIVRPTSLQAPPGGPAFGRPTVLGAAFMAAMAGASSARADEAVFDDPYDIPSAPRPPTLPELTHSDLTATLETTAGAIRANAGGATTHGYVQRLGIEVPVALRRWFVGLDYEVAAGDADGAFRLVEGNLQLQGRTVWATRTGLAFGGGFALGLPTATASSTDPTAAGVVALHAASLRPWDVSFFEIDSWGLRPFVDVRALDGPLVVQFRQGIDLMVSTGSYNTQALFGTAGVFFGWQATPSVAAGLEAFEAYAITVAGVSDGARSTVIVSPDVRLVLPWVEPAISAFTTIGTPLQGASQQVWGFRLALTLVYDANATFGMKGRR
jgi:hypothetical protein